MENKIIIGNPKSFLVRGYRLLLVFILFLVLSGITFLTVQNITQAIEQKKNITPEKVLENLDSEHEIKIIYTDEPYLNCGVSAFLEQYPDDEPTAGCFRPSTPDIIYLTTNIPLLSSDKIEYLVTHEYAHYLQFTNGEPLSECEAEKFVTEKGVANHQSLYANDCSSN